MKRLTLFATLAAAVFICLAFVAAVENAPPPRVIEIGAPIMTKDVQCTKVVLESGKSPVVTLNTEYNRSIGWSYELFLIVDGKPGELKAWGLNKKYRVTISEITEPGK
jgi:hypothetical protein